MSTPEFSPSLDALRNYELACQLALEGDEQMRRWFSGELVAIAAQRCPDEGRS